MYHSIQILGNLGRDPELTYMQSGNAVVNFNVASNRVYTTKAGDSVKETTWFRVAAFGKQAENCAKYLKKGSQVFVEGRMKTDKNGGPRVYERNDGTPAASFEVIANNIRFLGGGRNGSPREDSYDDNYESELDAWANVNGDNEEEEEDYPF